MKKVSKKADAEERMSQEELEEFRKTLENKTKTELGLMLSAGYRGQEHNIITQEYIKKKIPKQYNL